MATEKTEKSNCCTRIKDQTATVHTLQASPKLSFSNSTKNKGVQASFCLPSELHIKDLIQGKRFQQVQHAYYCGPPPMLVLWWMSFHVMTLLRPVVTERPTVKTSLRSKAFFSSFRTFWPSLQSGRKAMRLVPLYLTPGFGCSGCKSTFVSMV